MLRIDNAGRTRRIYVKRRDLLRANGLQPRDLRRIDPSQSLTKTSPNITVKENVLLTNLGGVRWGRYTNHHPWQPTPQPLEEGFQRPACAVV